MSTGILAVQGAFLEHGQCLDRLGAQYKYIRSRADITDDIDSLILPGGESTVQRKLIYELDLFEPLKKLIDGGAPVLGTCAGMILLAEKIANGDETVFGALSVNIRRNGYGRQLGSFSAEGDVGDIRDFPMRFIRAPYIESVLSDDTEVLNVTDGRITAVKCANVTGTAFHPELTDDMRIHERFLNISRRSRGE